MALDAKSLVNRVRANGAATLPPRPPSDTSKPASDRYRPEPFDTSRGRMRRYSSSPPRSDPLGVDDDREPSWEREREYQRERTHSPHLSGLVSDAPVFHRSFVDGTYEIEDGEILEHEVWVERERKGDDDADRGFPSQSHGVGADGHDRAEIELVNIHKSSAENHVAAELPKRGISVNGVDDPKPSDNNESAMDVDSPLSSPPPTPPPPPPPPPPRASSSPPPPPPRPSRPPPAPTTPANKYWEVHSPTSPRAAIDPPSQVQLPSDRAGTASQPPVSPQAPVPRGRPLALKPANSQSTANLPAVDTTPVDTALDLETVPGDVDNGSVEGKDNSKRKGRGKGRGGGKSGTRGRRQTRSGGRTTMSAPLEQEQPPTPLESQAGGPVQRSASHLAGPEQVDVPPRDDVEMVPVGDDRGSARQKEPLGPVWATERPPSGPPPSGPPPSGGPQAATTPCQQECCQPAQQLPFAPSHDGRSDPRVQLQPPLPQELRQLQYPLHAPQLQYPQRVQNRHSHPQEPYDREDPRSQHLQLQHPQYPHPQLQQQHPQHQPTQQPQHRQRLQRPQRLELQYPPVTVARLPQHSQRPQQLPAPQQIPVPQQRQFQQPQPPLQLPAPQHPHYRPAPHPQHISQPIAQHPLQPQPSHPVHGPASRPNSGPTVFLPASLPTTPQSLAHGPTHPSARVRGLAPINSATNRRAYYANDEGRGIYRAPEVPVAEIPPNLSYDPAYNLGDFIVITSDDVLFWVNRHEMSHASLEFWDARQRTRDDQARFLVLSRPHETSETLRAFLLLLRDSTLDLGMHLEGADGNAPAIAARAKRLFQFMLDWGCTNLIKIAAMLFRPTFEEHQVHPSHRLVIAAAADRPEAVFDVLHAFAKRTYAEDADREFAYVIEGDRPPPGDAYILNPGTMHYVAWASLPKKYLYVLHCAWATGLGADGELCLPLLLATFQEKMIHVEDALGVASTKADAMWMLREADTLPRRRRVLPNQREPMSMPAPTPIATVNQARMQDQALRDERKRQRVVSAATSRPASPDGKKARVAGE